LTLRPAGAKPPTTTKDLYQYPSEAPEAETTNSCPHLLNFIWRREFYSFSLDIGTKFCLDVRYHDP
jgi:hypothetical protein